MPDSRETILNAAEARLLAQGPAGLVLGAIAADAGVSKGGLLYHFASKEALVEGLCDRMLERFDEQLEALAAADPNPVGARTRAYLASTVTSEGKPADNSAQLMAGILATLGRDSKHLQRVSDHFDRWHEALAQDGIDPGMAALVRLAADGLWLSSLLGLSQSTSPAGDAALALLHEFSRAPVNA